MAPKQRRAIKQNCRLQDLERQPMCLVLGVLLIILIAWLFIRYVITDRDMDGY